VHPYKIHKCWVWGSHTGDYDGLEVMGYNNSLMKVVWFSEEDVSLFRFKSKYMWYVPRKVYWLSPFYVVLFPRNFILHKCLWRWAELFSLLWIYGRSSEGSYVKELRSLENGIIWMSKLFNQGEFRMQKILILIPGWSNWIKTVTPVRRFWIRENMN
jgi:hypothetical protein